MSHIVTREYLYDHTKIHPYEDKNTLAVTPGQGGEGVFETPPSPDLVERGGRVFMNNTIGDVSVTHRMSHIDDLPRCKACNKVLCQHPDAVFMDLAPA